MLWILCSCMQDRCGVRFVKVFNAGTTAHTVGLLGGELLRLFAKHTWYRKREGRLAAACPGPAAWSMHTIPPVSARMHAPSFSTAFAEPMFTSYIPLWYYCVKPTALHATSCAAGFILSAKQSPLWVPAGLLGSVLLTSSGFLLQTRGLKGGNTVVVCTMAATSSMISGVGGWNV